MDDSGSTKQEGQPGDKRSRMRDAEGTREAILDAGEEVFAEHGFDGARIDAIAEASGYNKSLIFQYFGDKLGLYSAVIRRADEETRQLQNRALFELMGPQETMDLGRLKDLLRDYIGWYFDYLIEHPRIMRIFNWELAEGWQTFSRIVNERDYQDVEDFTPVFIRLQKEGWMRRQPQALLQFTAAIFSVHTYLAIIPLYKTLFLGEKPDLDSPAALAQAREFVIDFIVKGLLVERPASNVKRGESNARRRQPKQKAG